MGDGDDRSNSSEGNDRSNGSGGDDRNSGGDKKCIGDSTAPAASTQLNVPASRWAAFTELSANLAEATGQPGSQLQHWERLLTEARAVADVLAYTDSHAAQITEAARHACAHSEMPVDRTEAILKQRLLVCGVYSASVPLDNILSRCAEELSSALHAAKPKAIRIQRGLFGPEHVSVRERAYPYIPSFDDTADEEVIEAIDETNRLLGYVVLMGAYVYDMAVDPQVMGCSVGPVLLRACGRVLQNEGKKVVSLDVRKCNEPAIRCYKKCGFQTMKRIFPAWYDWHGGINMSVETEALATIVAEVGGKVALNVLL